MATSRNHLLMKTLINYLLAASTAAVVVRAEETSSSSHTFAVVAKNKNNTFFSVVEEGCLARAAQENVNCLFVGPERDDPSAQADLIDAMIDGTYGRIDGISVSVSDATITGAAINRARLKRIPVITFDSDAKDSMRQAYVGTDNTAFGIELGKLLDQLEPTGGKYGILAADSPNVLERVRGVRNRLADTKWEEISDSYKNCEDNNTLALEKMYEFANENVDAIIPVGGWPMYESDKWKEFVDANRDIKLVVGDTQPVQLELMTRGYVHGLVGQLPFNMGEMSIDVLLKISQGKPVDDIIFGTSLLEVMQHPLILPPLEPNNNDIGDLAIMGYVLFSAIALTSLVLMVWTQTHRKKRVVKASQPFFLQMVLFGVLVSASALIPMTFHGRGSQKVMNASCMATPWLLAIGFTTVFSALYAKLWRINRIFHSPNAFARIKITEIDVLKPYAVVMGMNVITLSCWTAIAPLTYQQQIGVGTDDWNRNINTYGVCAEAGNPGAYLPYIIILVIINVGLLILANMQAYQARSIQTEYSESKYIALIMASMLQAFVLGVPCMILLSNQPRPYYIVLTLVVFCSCGVILFFMFWPKYYHHKMWEIEKAEKERMKKSKRAKIMGTPKGNEWNAKGDGARQMEGTKGGISPPLETETAKNEHKIATRADPTFKSTALVPANNRPDEEKGVPHRTSTVSLGIDDLIEMDDRSSQISSDEENTGLKIAFISTKGPGNSGYWLNSEPNISVSAQSFHKSQNASSVSLGVDDLNELDDQNSTDEDDEGLKVCVMATPEGFRNTSYWLNSREMMSASDLQRGQIGINKGIDPIKSIPDDQNTHSSESDEEVRKVSTVSSNRNSSCVARPSMRSLSKQSIQSTIDEEEPLSMKTTQGKLKQEE